MYQRESEKSYKVKRESNRRIFMGLALLGLTLCTLIFVPKLEAVQVKSVQRGSFSFAVSDTTANITINGVDQTKSIIYISQKGTSTWPSRTQFSATFDSDTLLRLIRQDGDSTTADIEWQVIEFTDGVSVQRGMCSFGWSETTRVMYLDTPIDQSKTFLVINYKCARNGASSDYSADERFLTRVRFTADDELTFNRTESGGVYDTFWQAVECEKDVNVQHGLFTVNAAQDDVTGLDSFPVDNSFLVFNQNTSGNTAGYEGRWRLRGTIVGNAGTNSTTIRFERLNTSSNYTQQVAWFLVELQDDVSYVQKGSYTGTGSFVYDQSIAEIERTQAWALGTQQVTGSDSTARLDDSNWTYQLTSNTNLRIEDDTASSPTACGSHWFAVEFCPLTIITPNGGVYGPLEIWQVGDTEDITWKHATALESGGSGTSGHHLLDIDLSVNGGTDNYPYSIATGIDAILDSYAWTIPADISGTDLVGEDLKVKITDTDSISSRNYDTSNDSFIIKGTLTIDQPSTWRIGDSEYISWDYTGHLESLTPDDVTIELSTDGSTFAHTLTATANVGTGAGQGGSGDWYWDPIDSDLNGENLIGTDNLLKITLNYGAGLGTTKVETTSTPVTLKGKIYNVTPLSDDPMETWYLGETKTISWDKKGHFGTGITDGMVDIFYSSNSGLTYDTPVKLDQTAGTDAAGGSYDWPIPLGLVRPGGGDYGKIKVVQSDIEDITVYGESKNFNISAGDLGLVAPNGTERWIVGSSEDIRWTRSDNLSTSNVKISVSRNTGIDYSYVTEVSANLNYNTTYSNESYYPWTVTAPITSAAMIKVEVVGLSEVVDESAAVFNIDATVTVVKPDSSDVWNIGETKDIRWSYEGDVGTVYIKVSRNAGGTWTKLNDGDPVPIDNNYNTTYANESYFAWDPVVAPESDQCRVRIENVTYPNDINGESPQDPDVFTLQQVITVTRPDTAGLVWRVGTQEDIEWSLKGAVTDDKVHIYYKKGTGTWNQITPAQGWASEDPPGSNSGSYPWDVPNDIHGEVYIKVEDFGLSNIYHESPAIKIKGNINVTAPVGDEVVKVSDTDVPESYTITWDVVGNVSGTADIRLSKDGGSTYPITLTEETVDINPGGIGNGSYDWTVTSGHIGADNMIMVALDGDENLTTGTAGESGSGATSFTVKPQVKLIYPNTTGITKNIGDTMDIRWKPIHSNFGNVMLTYSINGATGPFDGTITESPVPSNDNYDTTYPGESYYTWTILDAPGIVGTTVRVKVYKSDDETDVHDESIYDFAVLGNLELTTPPENPASPAVSPDWECGTQQTIAWDLEGSGIGDLYIYYSKNNGADNFTNAIVDTGGVVTATDGSYTWTIPDDDTIFKTGDDGKNTEIRIKIRAADDDRINSESAADKLTIKARFVNLVPNSGSIFVGTEDYGISWQTQGGSTAGLGVANVNLKYDTAGSGTYTGTVVDGISNVDGYTWLKVDCPLDNPVRIKVESAVHSDIYKESGDLTAKGMLELTVPDATNVDANALIAEETFRIEWVVNDNVGKTGGYDLGDLDIYYAPDGTTWEDGLGGVGTPVATVPASGNSYYDWTVPADKCTTSTNKIKIEDQDDATNVNSVSANFDIKGKLYTISGGEKDHWLEEPNGGEVYYVGGADIDVQWRYKGDLGTCEIYYDDDSGTLYDEYVATVAHDKNEDGSNICHHAMTVPGAAGTTYRVKIYDTNDGTYVYAESQNDFVLKGDVVLQINPVPSPGMTDAQAPRYVDDTNVQIYWAVTGGISLVDILLDVDEGNNGYGDLTITSTGGVAGNSSPYSWDISALDEQTRKDITSDKCRIRLRDHNDTSVTDDSLYNFTIKPRIFIGTPPQIGTLWIIEESQPITWTTTGTVGWVRLYSTPDGSNWYEGPTWASGDSGSLWTIPEDDTVAHNNAKIKLVRVEEDEFLVKYEDTDVESISPTFSIGGKIVIDSPLTNQSYNVLSAGDIEWHVKGDVGNVKIMYNTDTPGFPDGSWVTFSGADDIVPDYCTNVPGTPYSFNTPENTAPEIKLRVAEVGHEFDIFGPAMAGSPTHSYKGNILFDKPSAGAPNTSNQTIIVDQQHYIEWSNVGTFTTLKAYYKKIGDAQWTQIGSDLDGSTTSLYYTPSDSDITAPSLSDKVLFRVEDALDAQAVNAETPSGEGNNIIGSLGMMEPILDQEMTVGDVVTVKWEKYGDIGNLKFELWNGTQWLDNAGGSGLPDSRPCGASGASGVSLSWAVPDEIYNLAKIRVTAIDYDGLGAPYELQDESDTFIIKGDFTSITTPGIWYVGEDHYVNWEANGIMSTVDIELYVPGTGYITIENGYDGHDNVPAGLKSGTNTYLWHASDTTQQQRSEGCKIRITSTQNSDVSRETNVFTLKPEITVTTPSQAWVAESNSNLIEWDAIVDPTTNIDIILEDLNAGTGYPKTLAANLDKSGDPPASLSYTSTVTLPAALTDSAKIHIRDAQITPVDYSAFVYGESNLFDVIGEITIDKPDSTCLDWKVGDTNRLIEWDVKGDIGDVKIYADYNGDGTMDQTLYTYASSSGYNSWTWEEPGGAADDGIGDYIGNNVEIKIADADAEAVTSDTSETFRIIGGFTFAYPLGGEVFHIDDDTDPTAFTVIWNTLGSSISKVKLEYYHDTNGWTVIDANANNPNHGTGALNENTYVWDRSIPDPGKLPIDLAATNIKFRITSSDPVQPTTELESNEFVICGDVSVTAPTQGVIWTADGLAANAISWDVYGPTTDVKISYCRDSGSTWTELVASMTAEAGDAALNKGAYDWTIPTDPSLGDYITRVDAPASEYSVIKVEDATTFGTYVTDDSLDFTVKGQLRIIAPASGTFAAGLDCGDSHTITFERDGRINAVNVKYATDGASYSNVIESDITFATINDTQQSTTSQWSVPETPVTDTYKLLIEDANYEKSGTAGTYVESAAFRVKGGLTLTAPTSTDIWRITEQKTISWEVDHGQLDYVKIIASPSGNFSGDEYDVVTGLDPFSDSGFDEGLLPARVGTGSHPWTIPVDTSLVDTIKFKIVHDNASFTDVMSGESAAMDLRGTITVQTPTSDYSPYVDWNVGDTDKVVKFTAHGTDLGTVYIYISMTGMME